jgi:HD-GYP domain-containing protein (c-di-GMP phosphodiesterase class II)
MAAAEAYHILSEAVSEHRLDQRVVDTLHDHLDELNNARRSAQNAAFEEYHAFINRAEALTSHPNVFPLF